MRRKAPAIALALAAALLAACGNSGTGSTPAACLSDVAAYRQALAAAPGEVRLGGATPISGCLVEGQSGGELAQVGQAMVLAATQLNETARKDPTGPAAVQLGYLIGAAQQGASTTGGIHSDLIRRLDTAARFTPGGGTLPADFERTFGEGYAAGQRSG
ncbi:MAG: hypothetical protein ABR536_07155 [Solirubrobacterales bacterium]